MATLINPKILLGYGDCLKDDSFGNQLLQYFSQGVPTKVDLALSNLQALNYDEFKKNLHQMKNSFLNVGAESIAEECQFLEDNVLNMSRVTLLERLNKIVERFEIAKTELKFVLDKLTH